MSNRDEKVNEVMERAKNHGLRLEFDSGLILVKRTEIGDSEKQDAIVAELGKYLSDVRRLVERRAIGERAKVFVGQRIWSEQGKGALIGTSDDGRLSISIGAEMRRSHEEEVRRSQLSINSDGKSLLIVLDDAPAPADEEPVSETPRKRLFGMF